MAEPNFFATPTGIAIIAAGGSFVAGLVGASISSWTIRATHRQRIATDEKLADRKFNFDKDLAERKFEFDTKLSEQKLKHDRELHDHKRRVELAEELVAEFRQSRDVIRAVRSPMSYADEGAGRPPGEAEIEAEAQRRDTYYVPLVRLKNNSAFLNGLLSKRYRAQALFGQEIDQPFRHVLEVMVSIQTAAQMLIGMVGPRGGRDEMWDRLEGNIWGGFRDDDPLTRKMDDAIAAIEAVSRPILQAR